MNIWSSFTLMSFESLMFLPKTENVEYQNVETGDKMVTKAFLKSYKGFD